MRDLEVAVLLLQEEAVRELLVRLSASPAANLAAAVVEVQHTDDGAVVLAGQAVEETHQLARLGLVVDALQQVRDAVDDQQVRMNALHSLFQQQTLQAHHHLLPLHQHLRLLGAVDVLEAQHVDAVVRPLLVVVEARRLHGTPQRPSSILERLLRVGQQHRCRLLRAAHDAAENLMLRRGTSRHQQSRKVRLATLLLCRNDVHRLPRKHFHSANQEQALRLLLVGAVHNLDGFQYLCHRFWVQLVADHIRHLRSLCCRADHGLLMHLHLFHDHKLLRYDIRRSACSPSFAQTRHALEGVSGSGS